MSHAVRLSRTISIKLFLATLLPVLIGCVYLTQNWEALTRSCEKGADHELLGIAVELAKNAEALTGAYSRFGFRHPGPAFPYWYAVCESLAPFQSTPMGTHLVGQAILNLALMCVACWWFVCFVRPRALALFMPPICLIVWWGAGRTFLHDYWNPTTTIAPMLVLLLSGAALMRAHVAWSFPFAVSAVLLIHSHLSSAPLVALISVSVLVAYLLARRRTKRARWTKREGVAVAASIVVAILGILPIAIDALRGPGLGNLERIAATLSSPGERTSLAAATRLVGHYFSFGALGIEIYALLFFLVCMLIAWHVLREKQGSVLRAALMLCFIGTFAAIFAASRIRGNIDPYILRSTLGLVTASTALLMALASQVCRGPTAMQWMSLSITPE